MLRDIAAKAHDHDRKAGGDLVFKAIFPNGFDAEVRPLSGVDGEETEPASTEPKKT